MAFVRPKKIPPYWFNANRSFSPYDLGNDLRLALETTNPATSNTTATGSPFPLIGLKDFLQDSSGIYAWLDRSKLLEELQETLYDFQFSDNGFSFTNVINSGLGQTDPDTLFNDWMLLEDSSSGLQELHSIGSPLASLTANKVYAIEFDIYTTGTIDGVSINENGASANPNVIPLSAGYNRVKFLKTTFVNTSLQIFTAKSGINAYISVGDFWYIRNIVISEVQGNHFFQSVAADRPQWDAVNNEIDFDGVSDFLTRPTQVTGRINPGGVLGTRYYLHTFKAIDELSGATCVYNEYLSTLNEILYNSNNTIDFDSRENTNVLYSTNDPPFVLNTYYNFMGITAFFDNNNKIFVDKIERVLSVNNPSTNATNNKIPYIARFVRIATFNRISVKNIMIVETLDGYSLSLANKLNKYIAENY